MITISAERLQKSSPRIIALNKEVNSMIQRINNDIKNLARSNTTFVDHSLMSYFDIPGMKNEDAQKIIWGKAIEALEKTGFEVTVVGSRDEVKLRISWDMEYNKTEIARYHNLILSRHEGYRKKRYSEVAEKRKQIQRYERIGSVKKLASESYHQHIILDS